MYWNTKALPLFVLYTEDLGLSSKHEHELKTTVSDVSQTSTGQNEGLTICRWKRLEQEYRDHKERLAKCNNRSEP